MRVLSFALLCFLLLPESSLANYEVCKSIKIFDLRTKNTSYIPMTDFLNLWETSIDVLLVGESHGESEHPQVAACLLVAVAAHPTKVVLEMLRADQQDLIDAHQAVRPETIGELATKLHWWDTGWPRWDNYAPFLDVVWVSRSKLKAADLPKSDKEQVPPIFLWDDIEDTTILDSWTDAMERAHCGLIGKEQARLKARQQMLRDAFMAKLIGQEVEAGTKVMFYAGRAHIREDRGLVADLRSKHEGFRVATFALIGHEGIDNEKITEQLKNFTDVYDFVAFAGKESRDQQC